EGLREVLITGGLAPVTHRPVDEVYAATWARVREANQRYHARYAGDLDRLRTILRRLDEEDVRLPSGERLTARRFRQIGMWLGDSAGFERLHHLLELPFVRRRSSGTRSRRRRGSGTRSTRRCTSPRMPT